MKRIHLLFIAFVLGCTATNAQNFVNLSGKILDDEGLGLPSATILLMSPDSVMEEFGITKPDGSFQWKNLRAGEYILQVSFMGYQMAYQNLNLNQDLSLEPIQMEKATYVLDEVVAEDEFIPLSIKGDTIKYKADAFATKPNAVVEDLLKQLPGVEVEPDGTIRAQGEEVQNVLVDGKRFFGDDPKMATKNLPADAVDEVQVFDKLSDMAEFTGIDDGNDEKTINLELKEGAKAGYFGQAYAGGGYDPGLYEGKLSVNRFNSKAQTSLIASANNANDQSFSIQDYIQFMGGISSLMSGGGMLMLDPGDLPGNPDEGINHSQAIGLNYNREIGKNWDLQSSYFFSGLNNQLEEKSDQVYIEGQPLDFADENSYGLSNAFSHRINYRLKYRIDSSQDMLFRGNFQVQDGFQKAKSTQRSFGNNGELLNLFDTQNSGIRNLYSGNAIGNYRKRLSKDGRNLVVEGETSWRRDKQTGNLNSENLREGALDQEQDFEQSNQNLSGMVRYTEPLGNGYFLQTLVSASSEKIQLEKSFFDQVNDDLVFNPEFSNAYTVNQSSKGGGITLQRNRKKTNLRAGLRYEWSSMVGKPEGENEISRDYQNFLPFASFRYRIKSGMNFRFDAQSSLVFPEMQELQPVVDNTNPFNLYVGNPDLDAARNYDVQASYSTFSQFSFISFFTYLNYSETRNAIQNAVSIDSNFRQVLQPVNVDYRRTLYGSANYSMPIRPLRTKINLSLRENITQTIQPINGVNNVLHRQVHTLGIRFENRKKEKWDLQAGGRFSWNNSVYSTHTEQNQSFLNSDYYGTIRWYGPRNWTLETGLNYQVYSSQNFSEDMAIPLWSAKVSKLFLKDNRGELSLRASDLLNQNQGFSRNAQWNYLEERTTNNLGRFVMFRFAYSLKGFKKQDDGVEIHIGG